MRSRLHTGNGDEGWRVWVVSHVLCISLILGGLIMLPVKHGEPTVLNYKSGFYITCNEVPNFVNPSDQEAIETRLAIFRTRSLPEKDSSVTCMYM